VNGCDDYHLGLPAWAFPGWKDRYFTDEPSRLASYASVFDTVEGNTTFYGIPDAATTARWRAAVDGTRFRFCFKLPRGVTHEGEPAMADLERFLSAIDGLRDRLGPMLVQFPATVGPVDLPRYEPVFERLGGDYRFVIEVRHPAFFDEPELLEPTLMRHGAGRVVLDSRPLYEGDRSHPEVLDALHEKPDVAVRPVVYNGIAFVRLILHPAVDSNVPYINEWSAHVRRYLAAGNDTWMMIHCPNNLHCPPLAERFHRRLMSEPGMTQLAPLSAWPRPEQMKLI